MVLLREARETPTAETNVKAAREMIAAAKGNVVFLGFAYSVDNLERALKGADTLRGKTVRGTIVGIDGEQKTELDQRFRRMGLAPFPGWGYTVEDAVRLLPLSVFGEPKPDP
jgi:hypothetical protein